jgi:amino acid transporter
MRDAEILIPILVPLGAFAMVFGIIYLRTRENMAMVDKGMNPKRYANLPAPFRSLKNGLLLIGAGVGLLLAYIISNAMNGRDEEVIYFSLIAIGGGLGLVGSYAMEKKEYDNTREYRQPLEHSNSRDHVVSSKEEI